MKEGNKKEREENFKKKGKKQQKKNELRTNPGGYELQ
jgi:hypothetical protein